jgi:hypothetical protein
VIGEGKMQARKGRTWRPWIADKEGKSVVFPSLWLAAENQ